MSEMMALLHTHTHTVTVEYDTTAESHSEISCEL